MDVLAKISDVVKSGISGKTVLSLECYGLPTIPDELLGKDLSVTIKPHREKRSLSANAYYWTLLGKLASAVGVSNDRMHNLLLRRYGEQEIVNGELVCVALPDSDDTEDYVLEAVGYHLKPTSRISVGKDGKLFRIYTLLRGSSSLDSKSMARLIEGLIDECKALGIETLSPEEIERMVASIGRT